MHSKIRLVISCAIACVGGLATTLVAVPATAGMNSWTAIGPDGANNPIGAPFAVDPSSPSTIYSVVNGGTTIMKTTDGGGHWAVLETSSGLLNFEFLVIDPASPATIYAGGGVPWDYGDDSVYKSIDGGVNWAAASNGLPSEIRMLAIAPSLSTTLYAGEPGVGVFKSIDGGLSWAVRNNGLTALSVSALAIDPTNADAAYVAIEDAVFKLTPGTDQWRQVPISIPAGTTIVSLAIDLATPSVVYASYTPICPFPYCGVFADGGVFKSTDSGETWIAARNGLSSDTDTNGVHALAIDPSAPARIYAATEHGVFTSTDAAASWTPINAGLTDLYVWGISIDRTGSILRTASKEGLFEYRFSGALQSPGAVVEYQNTQDFPGSPGGHFFYTDDAGEQAMVDSGVDGNFVRTGKAFKAGGSKQVCRFYGSIAPGPNSHFYTISDQECDWLKSLQKVPTPTDVQQWNYERPSFTEEPPQIGATGPGCTPGMIPVYRGYNNAYPAAGPKNPWDSVHRYSASPADIQQMVTQFGWRDEGIAFCSPP